LMPSVFSRDCVPRRHAIGNRGDHQAGAHVIRPLGPARTNVSITLFSRRAAGLTPSHDHLWDQRTRGTGSQVQLKPGRCGSRSRTACGEVAKKWPKSASSSEPSDICQPRYEFRSPTPIQSRLLARLHCRPRIRHAGSSSRWLSSTLPRLAFDQDLDYPAIK